MTEESSLKKYRMEIILAGILILSAFLNIWNIWNLGYSNDYYAAAVRSMLENPSAAFFNSFDAGGFVTVDKPPVGLWVQALSAIIFGFSGWALILPQALAGVASVALLYCIVSRPFGKPAGLIAAFALAVTPVFVAVSRNGTMDGILIFIILLAVWTALKAARENSLPFLLLAVTLVGIGFNIKMIQAFIIVPAVLVIYLLGAGKIPWKNRFLHILMAITLLAIVSLSWAVIVDAIPADQRPFIGGSGDNTVMGLIINYNGIHRLGSDGTTGPGGSGGIPGSGTMTGAGDIPPGTSSSRNQSAGQRDAGMMSGTGGIPGQGMQSRPYSMSGLQGGTQEGITPFAQTRNQSSGLVDGRVAPDTGGLGGQGMPYQTGTMQQGGLSTGNSPAAPGGMAAPGGRTGGGGMDNTGSPGILRLFGSGLAGQLSWLLPFALIGLLAWIRRPAELSGKALEDAGYFSERGLVLLAMCLWLFPGLIYFSFTTGFWHTYYLATITPPLAALVGIGATGMYTLFREGAGPAGLLFIGAVLVTGLVQAAILSSTGSGWSGTVVLLLANAILAVVIILAVLTLTRRHRSGTIPRIAVAVAVGLLLITPTIWAFSTMANGGGTLPAASGPQAVRGSIGGMPGNGMGQGGSSGKDFGLADYLVSHKSSERWIVAVASSREASGIILSTGEPAMAMGGFTGSDRILTIDRLTSLISNGEIRYFYLSGGTDNRGGSAGNALVSSWVSSHCTVIPATEYGGADTGSTTSPAGMQAGGLPGGGSNTLYDCRGAAG